MAKSTPKLKVKKPKNVFTKPLQADFKELFKSLAKGIGHTAVGKWEEIGSDTAEALSNLTHLPVSDDQAHRLKMGNPVILRGRNAPVAESEVYATARGKLIAIGEIEQGEFRPKRVFG